MMEMGRRGSTGRDWRQGVVTDASRATRVGSRGQNAITRLSRSAGTARVFPPALVAFLPIERRLRFTWPLRPYTALLHLIQNALEYSPCSNSLQGEVPPYRASPPNRDFFRKARLCSANRPHLSQICDWSACRRRATLAICTDRQEACESWH